MILTEIVSSSCPWSTEPTITTKYRANKETEDWPITSSSSLSLGLSFSKFFSLGSEEGWMLVWDGTGDWDPSTGPAARRSTLFCWLGTEPRCWGWPCSTDARKSSLIRPLPFYKVVFVVFVPNFAHLAVVTAVLNGPVWVSRRLCGTGLRALVGWRLLVQEGGKERGPCFNQRLPSLGSHAVQLCQQQRLCSFPHLIVKLNSARDTWDQ